MLNPPAPILGFVAASGTGKTTLLIQLIPLLKQQGLKVGLIKHSHHDFEIDKPGKDSFRLRSAGASPVMLISSHRSAVITEFEESIEPDLAGQLSAFEDLKLDLILVEGFRAEALPKIELHRAALNNPLFYPDDENIIAVASDAELNLPARVAKLDLNNPAMIAEFIRANFLVKNRMKDICSLEAKGLLSVEAALDRIQNTLTVVKETETVCLKKALGRILAAPVIAAINLPSDRNSAMDGYAFDSREVKNGQPFNLTSVGTSWAGRPFPDELQTGECVRIFTGAVLPKGADSVVMQEQVTVEKNTVLFPASCRLFQNVREIGEDVKQHSVLLNASKKLRGVDLGLLAAAGVEEVEVKRKLKIAFFSTGDELMALGQRLSPGQIYDSNRYILHGLLTDSRFKVNDMGVIPDNKFLLEQALVIAAESADVIITTGGASVGEADYIQDILAECGKVSFWKIAMKPGKPLIFGTIGKCTFFGLPGNPIAVMATFDKIVSAALRQLCGESTIKSLQLKAVCQSQLRKAAGRQEYQRGILQQNGAGEFIVESAGQQGSNILSTMSRANCYIVLPKECCGVQIGEEVIVEPFESLI